MSLFTLESGRLFQKIKKSLGASEKIHFTLALLFVIGFSLIPFVKVAINYGQMPDVYPTFDDIDHNYYYVRIHEVLDGHPFLGNPYYLEHSDKLSLAFSSAEWILALPMMLGLSFVHGLVLNNFIWAGLFFVPLFFLLREMGIERRKSLLAGCIIFVALAPLITRPVAMQIVFPFFLFFALFFLKWLHVPNRTNSVLLICAAASNFYIYSFSWQIIAVALLIVFGYFAITKNVKNAINAFGIGVLTIIGSFPVLFFTFYQMKNPLYWESALRTSMAITRIPSSGVIVYGGPLLIATALFYFLKKNRQHELSIFVYTMFLSLFVASMSNILTAKDPETASHVGRYMILFTYILFAFSLSELKLSAHSKFKKFIIVALVGLLFLYTVKEIKACISNLDVGIDRSVEAQAYSSPLKWLDKNVEKSSVILADPAISGYIPVLTHHYVVFSNYGGNHLLSNQEQIDRYILSNFDISGINIEMLTQELRVFAGTGPAIHQYKSINRRVRICRALRLETFGYSCGDYTDALSLLGKDYLPSVVGRAKTMSADLAEWYDRFGVSYLIIDTKNDPKFAALSLFTRKIYEDGRFEIWAR